MAFRVGSYFLVYMGSMLVLLWMFQITFLEPFYRVNQTKNIHLITSEVERIMNDTQFNGDLNATLRLMFSKENMCGVIYDSEGKNVMNIAVDLVGQHCYLGEISNSSIKDYMVFVDNDPKMEIDVPFKNEYFDQSLSFYGKKFNVNNAEYYLFINTPMELLDSTVEILKNQFLMVSFMVFSLGTVTSLLLAKRLAQPIHQMNEAAKKLADGDFSVQFEGEGYREAVELSETLNYATEEFSKTDELRRDLVANVSHDIKTPLTMIKAYAEMIVDISGDNPQLRNEHLKIILDETNHLEKFVNDMLSLSQYESQVLTVNETRFNLKDHIESTLNLFQTDDVKVKIDVPKHYFVMADEIKMGQVLYNFINNAIKHSQNSESIIIEAKANKYEITVSVIDFGVGIDRQHQEVIWDRYAQINKHHHRKESSSGLGLSIVAAICQATGSKYGVESEVGQGSKFYYTLKRVK